MLAAIALSGGSVYMVLYAYNRIRGGKQRRLHTTLHRDSQDIGANRSEIEDYDGSYGPISLSTNYRIAGVDLDRTTAIIVLTATTGVIHIALARPLMVLNGIGSLALLIPHYSVPQFDAYRNETRDVLIAYTAVTFIGFYAVKDVASWFSPIGIVCKLVELGLLALLWHERTNHIRLVDELDSTVPSTKLSSA